MKVKIGDRVYTEADGPIMLILTHEEREQIANMSRKHYKYARYLSKHFSTVGECEEWMDDDNL